MPKITVKVDPITLMRSRLREAYDAEDPFAVHALRTAIADYVAAFGLTRYEADRLHTALTGGVGDFDDEEHRFLDWLHSGWSRD